MMLNVYLPNYRELIRALIYFGCPLLGQLVTKTVGPDTTGLVVYMNPPELSNCSQSTGCYDPQDWITRLQQLYPSLGMRRLLLQSANVYVAFYCDNLGTPCTTAPTTSPSNSPTTAAQGAAGSGTGADASSAQIAFIGGLVGALMLLFCILLLCFCIRRKKIKKDNEKTIFPEESVPVATAEETVTAEPVPIISTASEAKYGGRVRDIFAANQLQLSVASGSPTTALALLSALRPTLGVTFKGSSDVLKHPRHGPLQPKGVTAAYDPISEAYEKDAMLYYASKMRLIASGNKKELDEESDLEPASPENLQQLKLLLQKALNPALYGYLDKARWQELERLAVQHVMGSSTGNESLDNQLAQYRVKFPSISAVSGRSRHMVATGIDRMKLMLNMALNPDAFGHLTYEHHAELTVAVSGIPEKAKDPDPQVNELLKAYRAKFKVKYEEPPKEEKKQKIAPPKLGVAVSDSRRIPGAKVTQVIPDSYAEQCGIMEGDIIISVNNIPVQKAAEFTTLAADFEWNGDVILGVKRDGEEFDAAVNLLAPSDLDLLHHTAKDENKKLKAMLKKALKPESYGKLNSTEVTQMRIEINDQWATGKSSGDPKVDAMSLAWQGQVMRNNMAASSLRVDQPDAASLDAGMLSGDIITAVNGIAVTTRDEFEKLLATCMVGSPVDVQVQRGKQSKSLDMFIGSGVLPLDDLVQQYELSQKANNPNEHLRRMKVLIDKIILKGGDLNALTQAKQAELRALIERSGYYKTGSVGHLGLTEILKNNSRWKLLNKIMNDIRLGPLKRLKLLMQKAKDASTKGGPPLTEEERKEVETLLLRPDIMSPENNDARGGKVKDAVNKDAVEYQAITCDAELDDMLKDSDNALVGELKKSLPQLKSRLKATSNSLKSLLGNDDGDESSSSEEEQKKPAPFGRKASVMPFSAPAMDISAMFAKADARNKERDQETKDKAENITKEDYEKAKAALAEAKPRLGLAVEDSVQNKAVRIVAIIPNSAAALAGLQAGDVITSWNGVPVFDHKSFTAEQQKARPGDDMFLVVLRAGKEINIIARMGAQGYTLEQIAQLRRIAASGDKTNIGVVKNKASAVKGAQTNFVKIEVSADGKVGLAEDNETAEVDELLAEQATKTGTLPAKNQQSSGLDDVDAMLADMGPGSGAKAASPEQKSLTVFRTASMSPTATSPQRQASLPGVSGAKSVNPMNRSNTLKNLG